MRLRKLRLTAPMIALHPNNTANCHGRGSGSAGPPAPDVRLVFCTEATVRQAPARTNVMKLARFCKAWSRERYLPRNPAGTSVVIHGSQAQLEIPRERLKQN